MIGVSMHCLRLSFLLRDDEKWGHETVDTGGNKAMLVEIASEAFATYRTSIRVKERSCKTHCIAADFPAMAARAESRLGLTVTVVDTHGVDIYCGI
jgi:hypothetical protein